MQLVHGMHAGTCRVENSAQSSSCQLDLVITIAETSGGGSFSLRFRFSSFNHDQLLKGIVLDMHVLEAG